MKRWIKWAVILGAGCCLAGCGIMILGGVMGGGHYLEWTLRDRADETVVEESLDQPAVRESLPEDRVVYKGVRQLDIQCGAGGLRVRESNHLNDGEVVILASGEGQSYLYRQDGDELAVWIPPDRNGQTQMKEVEIQIPERMIFREVELESVGNGELTVDRIRADSLTVDAEGGTVRMEDSAAGEAELDCSLGQISCRVSVERSVSAECAYGEIHLILDGNKDSYDYKLEAVTGQIVLGDRDPEEFQGMRGEENLIFNRPRRAELETGEQGLIHVTFAEEDFPMP